MSTFDGHVAEFPTIRIDNFRTSSDRPSPLAYFLSHVHADHLVGLDACRKVFVYCSPATREILLRLEKYRHRMNFVQGILEVRKQTYRPLGTLIKTIPLQTPTLVELSPGNSIRVTLLDANHCVGAVMFLIEGHGKAILYTGDIRSEAWWVDSLCRNPVLLPYVHSNGHHVVKKLDNIYLDTTYVASGLDRALLRFPSKQDGLAELLTAVIKFPAGTAFYVDAWTFGYEDVWQALSHLLGVQIHLDDYRYGLYTSLVRGAEPKAAEAHSLCGYLCGNHMQKGIFTRDHSLLHSCERGHGCTIFQQDHVRITPIVSRYQGGEIPELGVGGGLGDLDQHLELDLSSEAIVYQLIGYCTSKLRDQPELAAVVAMLQKMIHEKSPLISLRGTDFAQRKLIDMIENQDTSRLSANELSATNQDALDKLVPVLVELSRDQNASSKDASKQRTERLATEKQNAPRQIKFPYARHSSYEELCLLVQAFLPSEIYPCTVNESGWTSVRSMRQLFGSLYPHVPTFKHDQVMESRVQPASRDGSESPSVELIPGAIEQSRKSPTSAKRDAIGDLPSERSSKNVKLTSSYASHGIDGHDVQLHDLAQRQIEAYEAATEASQSRWWNIDLTSTRDGPHVRETEL